MFKVSVRTRAKTVAVCASFFLLAQVWTFTSLSVSRSLRPLTDTGAMDVVDTPHFEEGSENETATDVVNTPHFQKGSENKTATDRHRVRDTVFRPWPSDRPLPCFHPTDHNATFHWSSIQNLKRPATQGLFFLKLLKTGSTTGTSIHLRIAWNLARRRRLRAVQPVDSGHDDYEICKTRHRHGWAGPRMYKFHNRQRDASFLWTILREPNARYISEFFHFQVSRGRQNASDENAIQFFRNGRHSDHHYLSWLSTRSPQYTRRRRGGRPFVVANRIMEDYNFIGILERLHESVVALMMLLNIPMADVLFLSSKASRGYDDGEYKNTCFKIQPGTVSAGLQVFLESTEWRSYIQPERELYEAASRSLDRTIEALGRETFEANVKTFRRAQELVAERCEPNVRFPCSRLGEKRSPEETDCLYSDTGCGFDCLDEVATELDLW